MLSMPNNLDNQGLQKVSKKSKSISKKQNDDTYSDRSA